MSGSTPAQEPWEEPGWLSPDEFRAADGVEDWRLLGDGIYAFFGTDSFAAGARLVQSIVELPEIDDRRPADIDLRPDGVTVRLTTITVGHFFAGREALGYEFRRDTDEDVVDPRGRVPSFWFQQMDAPRPSASASTSTSRCPPNKSKPGLAPYRQRVVAGWTLIIASM